MCVCVCVNVKKKIDLVGILAQINIKKINFI